LLQFSSRCFVRDICSNLFRDGASTFAREHDGRREEGRKDKGLEGSFPADTAPALKTMKKATKLTRGDSDGDLFELFRSFRGHRPGQHNREEGHEVQAVSVQSEDGFSDGDLFELFRSFRGRRPGQHNREEGHEVQGVSMQSEDGSRTSTCSSCFETSAVTALANETVKKAMKSKRRACSQRMGLWRRLVQVVSKLQRHRLGQRTVKNAMKSKQ
jgi:hypothetical protein